MTFHFAGKVVLGRLNDVVEAADYVTRVDGQVELRAGAG